MSDDSTGVVAEGSRWSVLSGPHIYAVDEVIAVVIDRGLSSHGVKRDALSSVHLDGEALPEDKWCGAIGDRWLQMVFDMDLNVGVLLAANGTLFSKNVTMFEVKDNALKNDFIERITNTDTCNNQIDSLEVGSLDERVDKLALETQSIRESTNQLALSIDSLAESTNQLFLETQSIRESTQSLQERVEQMDQRIEQQDLRIEQMDQRIQQQDLRIDSLNERVKNDRIMACSSNVVDLLKDFGHVFLRYRPSSKMSAAKRAAIVAMRNDFDGKSVFLSVRDHRLSGATALSTYDRGYNSRAVLCAKVWMIRELFKQGLPKVRVPAL